MAKSGKKTALREDPGGWYLQEAEEQGEGCGESLQLIPVTFQEEEAAILRKNGCQAEKLEMCQAKFVCEGEFQLPAAGACCGWSLQN